MKAKTKITLTFFLATAAPLLLALALFLFSGDAWIDPATILGVGLGGALLASLLLGRCFGPSPQAFLPGSPARPATTAEGGDRETAGPVADLWPGPEEDDQRRRPSLALLCEASRKISLSRSTDEVLHTLADYAPRLVSAGSALAGRVEAKGIRVETLCYSGQRRPLVFSVGAGEYAAGRVLSEAAPVFGEGAAIEALVAPALARCCPIHTLLAVPILDAGGRVQGCLEVHNKEAGGRFDTADLEVLQALAAMAGSALTNRRLLAAQEQVAAELQASKAHLHSLAAKLSANTGAAYFRALVGHLCEELAVRYAFVARLSDDKQRVETLAVHADGQLTQNFSYSLAETPCERVVGEGVFVVPESVQSRFPRDTLLQEMGVESCSAVALREVDGEVIGLLVVLDSRPLREVEEKMSLLQLFAVRARAELQRQRNEEALKLAATAFQTHEAIMICDAKANILRVNRAFTTITGYTEAEVVGRNPRLLASGLQDDAFYQSLWDSLETQGFWQGELWNRNKQGKLLAEWLSINRVCDEAGQTTHYVGAFLDLTEQKAQQAFIERAITEEALLSTLLRLSHQGSSIGSFLEDSLRVLNDCRVGKLNLVRSFVVLTSGAPGEAVTCNEPPGEGCGGCPRAASGPCPAETVEGQDLLCFREAEEPLRFHAPLQASPGYYQVPLHDNGLLGVLVCCLRPEYETTSADQALLVRVADVLAMGVSRRQAEEQIEYQAYHDELTGLPNRRMLTERLGQEVAVAKRRGLHGALLFIDLDQFKRLNDALGHGIGDLLLQQVAERLRTLLRTQDTVARLGGDEFVVILPALDGDEDQAGSHAYVVAEKIRATLSRLYRLGEHEFQLTPSIGIVVFPAAGDTAGELLKHADAAMYQAKHEGRNTARFYQPLMQAQANERLALEKDLRRALANGELALHYQPQVQADGRVNGAEVLLRWHHPERGPVSPAAFIPVAEDAGLILDIGDWVLRSACQQIRRWERDGRACCQLAVNVSPKQFRQPGFVESVLKILDATGIHPGHLELELTEGMLIRDIEHTIEKMAQLRERGIRFSIDDFGTGYSSLNYLKRLPLDILKIDRSFVDQVHEDEQGAAICATIISMGRHLQLMVIAEGVETLEEQRFLQANGCDAYQGFYFSRPLPLAEFEAFVAGRSLP